MAMSGQINGTTSRNASKFDFYIVWDVINSQADRVANNRSQVRARIYLKTTNTVNTFDTVVARSHWAKIDGVQDSWSARIDCYPWPSNPVLLRTYTRYVTHNSNGTKSLNISAYVDGHASTWGPDNCNASATVTLDTIIKDLDADAITAQVDIEAHNADGVSGIGADAENIADTSTAFNGTTNATVTPLVAGANAMAMQPGNAGGSASLAAPPSVRTYSLGVQSKAARSTFPCVVPQGAQPGDVMLYVLHYQANFASLTTYAPAGAWAERTRSTVSGNHSLWVWERQVQAGEPGTTLEASTTTDVIGVSSIVILRDATYNAAGSVVVSTGTTTESAVAQGNSLNAGYIIVSDFEASEFGVGDMVQLYNSSDVLKESTIFTVTKMDSAFGFTNVFFTPNAAASPVTGDKVKSKAVTIGAVSPTRNECLLLEIASHYGSSASTTPILSSEAPGWETWINHPHYSDVASRRRGLIYVGSRDTKDYDPGFETSVEEWTATSGSIERVTAKAKQGRASCLFTANGGSSAGFATKRQFTVEPGQFYSVTGWLNANQEMAEGVGVAANWYNFAGSLISTSVTLESPLVETWQFREDSFEAPAGAAYATFGILCGGTPASGASLYADEVRISPIGPWVRTLNANASELSITLAYDSLTTLIDRLADFSFQIDWDNDGDWDDDSEDVTRRVLRTGSVKVKYGRDQVRALSPVSPGEANFVLNNRSGDYYPENLYSPLNGFIAPAKPVRIRAFTGAQEYTLFRGYIDGFDINPEPDSRSVGVSCIDALYLLREVQVASKTYPSIRSGEAIHAILDLVEWPTNLRDIDVGATTFRWWHAEGDAAAIVEEIVSNEGPPAFISISPNGEFVFRDRHHRLTRTESSSSQVIFRDKGTEPLFSSPMSYDHGWRDIVNTIEVDVPEVSIAGSLSVIWTSGDTAYSVASGRSIEIEAVSENPFIDPVTPELDTDYQAISGTAIISIVEYSATRLKLKITASGGAASITKLQVRGYTLGSEEATRRISLSDTASVQLYKERPAPSIGTSFATYEDVKAIATVMLAHRAERLPIVTFALKRKDDNVVRYVHMLGRNLSDRVTVVDDETGLNTDFYIEHIEHEIEDLGRFHTTSFGCEKVPAQVVGAFQLDTGLLDVNVLGREGMDDPSSVFILDSQNVLNSNMLGN